MKKKLTFYHHRELGFKTYPFEKFRITLGIPSKKFSDFIYPFLENIVMLLLENQLYDESFNPIGNTFKYFIEILESINKICYDVFQFGNIIMFLIFMFMSLNLLLSAREREYKEKINARNLMFLKKRGRIGTVICFFLAIGYLVKVIPILVLLCLKPFPAFNKTFFLLFYLESILLSYLFPFYNHDETR